MALKAKKVKVVLKVLRVAKVHRVLKVRKVLKVQLEVLILKYCSTMAVQLRVATTWSLIKFRVD